MPEPAAAPPPASSGLAPTPPSRISDQCGEIGVSRPVHRQKTPHWSEIPSRTGAPTGRPGVAGRLIIGLLGLVLVVSGCAGGSSPGSDQPGFVSGDRSITLVPPADRRPAPPIEGARLSADASGGATVTSTDYAGQVLVLNVWGSWCNPCRAEAKDLQAASQQTGRTAQFLGLNTKDYSPAPALAFLRSFGVTYPQIFDPEGKVLVSLAAVLPPNAIPTTLVIDKQGRVAARIAGTVSKITLVNLIKDVAAGR